MPLRVMGYDYATYKKQYDTLARQYKEHKTDMDEHEFLSRMKKTDRLMPVITVVLYYGEKDWDAATWLHGILNIPMEMVSYVNDYRMLLVRSQTEQSVFS